MVLVIDDEEGNKWLEGLLRHEYLELAVAAIEQPKNARIWQKSKGHDLQGNEITEGQFIKIDPLGDWIEDHGGKREWSDGLMVLGCPMKGDGRGKSASNLKDPVRVDHCGLSEQEDPFLENPDDGR